MEFDGKQKQALLKCAEKGEEGFWVKACCMALGAPARSKKVQTYLLQTKKNDQTKALGAAAQAIAKLGNGQEESRIKNYAASALFSQSFGALSRSAWGAAMWDKSVEAFESLGLADGEKKDAFGALLSRPDVMRMDLFALLCRQDDAAARFTVENWAALCAAHEEDYCAAALMRSLGRVGLCGQSPELSTCERVYALAYLRGEQRGQKEADADIGLLVKLAQALPGAGSGLCKSWAPAILNAARGIDDETDPDTDVPSLKGFKAVAEALAQWKTEAPALGSKEFAGAYGDALSDHLGCALWEQEPGPFEDGLAGAKALAMGNAALTARYRNWLLEQLSGAPEQVRQLQLACQAGVELCRAAGKSAWWLAGADGEEFSQEEFEKKLSEYGDACAPLRSALENSQLRAQMTGRADALTAQAVTSAQMEEFSRLALGLGDEPKKRFEEVLEQMREAQKQAMGKAGDGAADRQAPGSRRGL